MGALDASGEMRSVFLNVLRSEMAGTEVRTHVDLEARVMGVLWIGEIEGERFWGLCGELWGLDERETVSTLAVRT